jgi:uncharacterized protein YbjT (DUF2867 family)
MENSPSGQTPPPRRVLVVGATGFLGAKIVANLLRDPTVAVRAMSRKGAPADAAPGAEWVRGDMMDPASLDHALEGVDVVVSSANGYMKESIEIDFAGNRNLVEAAAQAKVEQAEPHARAHCAAPRAAGRVPSRRAIGDPCP